MPELNPGQIVDVIVDRGDRREHLSSRILEVGPRGFAIFRPAVNGAPIVVGGRMEITFALGSAIWTLDCPVHSTISMRVDLGYPDPERIHRVQRRQHLRVAMTMPMDYQLSLEVKFTKPRQALLQDLSGGGCLLLISEAIYPGAIIRVHVSMEEYGLMEVMGRVIRVGESEKRRGGRALVAVEFYPIAERDRDRLVKFVFNKHREEVIRLKQRVR